MSIDNDITSYTLMSLLYNLLYSDDESNNSNGIVEFDEELPIGLVIKIPDESIVPIITIPPVLTQRTSYVADALLKLFL